MLFPEQVFCLKRGTVGLDRLFRELDTNQPSCSLSRTGHTFCINPETFFPDYPKERDLKGSVRNLLSVFAGFDEKELFRGKSQPVGLDDGRMGSVTAICTHGRYGIQDHEDTPFFRQHTIELPEVGMHIGFGLGIVSQGAGGKRKIH